MGRPSAARARARARAATANAASVAKASKAASAGLDVSALAELNDVGFTLLPFKHRLPRGTVARLARTAANDLFSTKVFSSFKKDVPVLDPTRRMLTLTVRRALPAPFRAMSVDAAAPTIVCSFHWCIMQSFAALVGDPQRDSDVEYAARCAPALQAMSGRLAAIVAAQDCAARLASLGSRLVPAFQGQGPSCLLLSDPALGDSTRVQVPHTDGDIASGARALTLLAPMSSSGMRLLVVFTQGRLR